ncbi:MAG: DUF2064 domain-containing protein [Chloroflexi bacterium]|nr:MAG: DUF2064 domain-containing protein [Chloroflexota bacterium]
MTRPVLVVLARSPVAGAGKTRLRHTLGDVVDHLAAAFLQDTLGWASQGDWHVLVAHHGPPNQLRSLAPHAWLIPQVDGDLGARITSAVATAFGRGGSRVVLIGTDSPTLPHPLVAASFAALSSADATVVPAIDGGWVAIGVTSPLDDVLDQVPWSSAMTCAETVRALQRTGRHVVHLPPWYDIDELADLRRLREELGGPAAARSPRTAALLQRSSALVAALGRIAA